MLLNEYYPALPAMNLTITYELRGFTPEEAKVIFHTRPQLLSLNEMFMVANIMNTIRKSSKTLFDVAVRLYPNSPVAQFNVAAMEMEQVFTKGQLPGSSK